MGADRAAQGAGDVFSPIVTDYWLKAFASEHPAARDATFTVAVNAGLSADRPAMLLHTVDGAFRAVMTPSVADALGLPEVRPQNEAELRRALSNAGVAFHAPDNLFYFSRADLDALLADEPHPDVRQLSDADAELFARFQSEAPQQELDEAYVELDHWAVFGAFAHDRLVTAASVYPWGDARIADVGVLTLPEYRRRGRARAVVRALCRFAAQQGFEPQYRCRLDNHASRAVAEAAGLTHFGTWEAASSESPST
jgi:RimJ/RimL family protein N-acetyltransferase